MKKLPMNPNIREKARYLRTHGTLSEVLLWNKLKNRKFFGLDYDRQKIIGNYIVDFYCPALELVIEIDGNSHDFKGDYDIKRNDYLIGLGLKILHINDRKIKRDMNGTLELLKVVKDRIESGTAPAGDSFEWIH
jgi:very-short-patch-repair endonuclease